MATLVLTALGTAIGGPLGGAVGGLLGNRLDRSIAGSGQPVSGVRLQDLAVSTSSYGQPVPRHFGTVRAAGTIIWSTELTESSERQGGGKNSPAVTSYSYSVSLAVALASRPIARIGRIWADGQLLRGAAGDLKVGGRLRLYHGHGDQQPDPLIAADLGASCPAFRGLAYCVFEGLQLASYGNRIPALTFEIVADEGGVELADIVAAAGAEIVAERPLPGLAGWSDGGDGLAACLADVGELYPLTYRNAAGLLAIAEGDGTGDVVTLPEAAVAGEEEADSLRIGGQSRRLAAAAVPAGIRYYDPARDYQIGTQLSGRSAGGGGFALLDFPGVLAADDARMLAARLADRASARLEVASWHTAELSDKFAAGSVVRIPGRPGRWRVESWELGADGVALELVRLPITIAEQAILTDAGRPAPPRDLSVTPTWLAAFELPSANAGDTRQVHVAASSATAGWTGAALYLEQDGDLVPVGTVGARRSVVGTLASDLPPSQALFLERDSTLEVAIAADQALTGVPADFLAQGANRALIGDEIVQFVAATRLGGGRWRLSGLLRGRGGTEAAAWAGCAAGRPFVLLDDSLTALDSTRIGANRPLRFAALGLADAEPVWAELGNAMGSVKPLSPVHPLREDLPDGGVSLSWTRRLRGGWDWPDLPAVPGAAEAECYQVGIGDPATPAMGWTVVEPRLVFTANALAELHRQHPRAPLWTRQVSPSAMSDPLLLIEL